MNESESLSIQEESQHNEHSTFPEEHLPEQAIEEDESFHLEQAGEGEEPLQTGDDSTGSSSKEEGTKKVKEEFTPQFLVFKKLFDAQPDIEAKLQLTIDFMEATLGQGTPHFRSFWEARRLCLPLFRENVSPTLRSNLWNKYVELSKEARRLKEILDEQSAFAVEQIEIAIQALEKEISQFQEQVEKAVFTIATGFPQALKEHMANYESLQRQLNVLNAQASRINGLRKELLKTEMRVRQKNKFFQSLSSAGDHVFPKRKELIKEISKQFSEDVDHFIKIHFGENPSKESLYVLREEIKALQGLAKLLTLNTHSFTQTRKQLSECWDKLKVEEKERKKERAQQRVAFKQNAEEVHQQIVALKEIVDKNEGTTGEAQKRIDDITALMRRVELGRDEVKALRDELNALRKIIHDRSKADLEVRQQQEAERDRQKKERYHILKGQIETLLNQHEVLEVEQLAADRDSLAAQIHDAPLTKNEKQELDRLIKPLRDMIAEKREKALMELSEDDRQALQQMQTILKQRKERRQEIKNQLEVYRKGAGSSSLDFEKAMAFTAQIQEEKERLEKINQGIVEIEQRIAELQSKIRGKVS